jgi:hypothetical protein
VPSEVTETPKPAEEPPAVAAVTPEEAAVKQKPEETPPAAPDAKAEPQPKTEQKPKPEAKPKPAVPDKKPFADLPAIVALPDLEAADAMNSKTLGSVYIPESELCFIKLRAGEHACKGGQVFVMRNADGGLAERDWEILVREGEGGPETKISHLSVNDKHQLNFQWQPEAKTQNVSPYLVNCALALSCGGESHVVSLRQPSQVEAMAVDLEKGMSKQDWDIELCPNPEAVRLEIVGVAGAKYTVEPAAVMAADKSEAWVRLQDGGGMVSLKLDTSMRRNLQVSVTPYIKLTSDARPEKFTSRILQTALTQAQQQQQQWAAMVQQGQQLMRQARDDQQKRQIQARLALAETNQTASQTTLENLQKLDGLLKQLSGGLQIKFRVFLDAGLSQIELLRIGA